MKHDANQLWIPRRVEQSHRRGIPFVILSHVFSQIVLVLAILAVSSQVGASVLVAPTVVVLSDEQRTGRMILRNPSDQPQEVSVDFMFGLPESDSLGNLTLSLDSTVSDPHSAVGWIRAFPRRIVMPPGSEQTVRFVARPPKDLAEGEYWARIVVSSQNSQPPELQKTKEGVISARLNTVIQTAISLKYRKGDLISKVELNKAWATRTDSTVSVFVDMTNRGNVSYLGVLAVKLIDANGKEILERSENTAVYYNLRRRMDFQLPAEPLAEPIQAVVTVATEGRKDVPSKDVVPGNAIEYSMAVE